jgi:hypothetical protein
MKSITITLLTATLVFLAACKKDDYCDKPTRHESGCDLMQVLESSGSKDDPNPLSRYRKEYDPTTGKISKVVVGLFQFGLIDSVRLIPKYHNDNIHFVSEDNATDTVITATFDHAGRLLQLNQGNAPNDRLIASVFSYSSDKLSNLHFDLSGFGFDLVPSYDSHGNVTQLKDPTEVNQSFFYTYDVSVEATQQFYSDDFVGDGYNSLYFAEFMGWLPDLLPVNKRTSERVVTGDYELSNADLTSHVYDADGKLLSYQSGATFTNIWNCDSKTNKANHGHSGHHNH